MYDFSDLKLSDHIETCSNPKGNNNYYLLFQISHNKGLCCINNEPENQMVLACPDKTMGNVSLFFYKDETKENTIQIKAHNSPLTCMELDNRGLKLATASEKVLFQYFLRKIHLGDHY